MSLDDLTIGEAKQLAKMFGNKTNEDDSHWEIGEPYFIRTVTMIQTGRLVKVTDKEIVLQEAAWIPDTGRFSDSLKSLNFDEVEPFPDGNVIVGRGAILDAVKIHDTQRNQK